MARGNLTWEATLDPTLFEQALQGQLRGSSGELLQHLGNANFLHTPSLHGSYLESRGCLSAKLLSQGDPEHLSAMWCDTCPYEGQPDALCLTCGPMREPA